MEEPMGFWNSLMRRKAEAWTYLELGADQVPTGLGHEPIAPDTAYLTLTLKSFRIVDTRTGVRRFYGAVHSWASVSHIGSGRAEFQVVTTPGELKDADAQHLDRVISMDRPLLGPVPYRGGGLGLELGLFSVLSGDLVGPFLDVLEIMSKAAGVTFFTAALPFVEPLTKGISLLTGTSGDSLLEIGLSKYWEPTTGYYGILRAPRGQIHAEDITVASDQRLVYSDGSEIQNYPYIVFSVEATRSRPNWFEIPELKKAFDELNNEVKRGRIQDAEQAFSVFRAAALTSPDLLFEDAKRVSENVNTRVKEVLHGIQTASSEPESLPALAEFSPFV
jgi:hypothetical protein